MTERTFDWKPNHDARSWNFRTTATPTQRSSRRWLSTKLPLDQGQEGACVGHGVTGAIVSSPLRAKVKLPNPQQTAFGMYFGSRFIDEWPGEAYDGTSVNAGCKLAKSLGLISEWRWAFGIDDIRNTVAEVGPVVIGIPWYESMYSTDEFGLVAQPSGALVGGHCILVTGWRRFAKIGSYEGPVFEWTNSWGLTYGIKGRGFVPESVFEFLIKQDGEAAVLF